MKASLCMCTLAALCLLASCWFSNAVSPNSRAKRDVINRFIKKKGLGAAATALVAASSMTKKKFLPIPIVFPLPIVKPPIIETIPVPPFIGKHGFMGGYGGMGMGGMGGMGMGMGGFGMGGFGR